jgi:glucuronoarabinoxylan endo-1,4-beta-xylanase
MAQADASAWFWWWPVVSNLQPGSQPASESDLIQVYTNGGYTITPRFFTIAQYSQFVRPGWSRITATHQPYCVAGSNNDQGCVNVTAFENPTTKQFAVIAINDTGSAVTQPFSLAGGTSASVTPYVTSSSQAMLQQSPIVVSSGTFSATLPNQSVTTFVGTAG